MNALVQMDKQKLAKKTFIKPDSLNEPANITQLFVGGLSLEFSKGMFY